MGIWDVKDDEKRAQWTFSPCIGVGPLRFGMSPDEVVAALDRTVADRSTVEHRVGKRVLVEDQFDEPGVTAYYTDSAQLACVAIDTLGGPQVTLDDVALVARVPSEAEEWLIAHTATHGLDLRYTHEGNPMSADLGLMLRAQRAGDVVLTRPLFLVRSWATEVWDSVPSSEWSRC